MLWIPVGMLIAGQASLLILSVDSSHKRLVPRARVWTSALVTGMLFMIITAGILFSLGVAVASDKFLDHFSDRAALWSFAGLWLGWATVFYLYLRDKADMTTRVMNWLLRGSVLELLIAVPSHVIVRRREECSAPVATSFGITTGIAIMLLSFGPGVLLLYKKRLDSLRKPTKRGMAVR